MRSESSMGRGVVTLVLAGAVLGVLYNGAGRMSHPRRGVPWLAERTGVADLDTLALRPPTSSTTPGAPAATPGTVPDSSARAETATPPKTPPAPAPGHGTAAHARPAAAQTRERTPEAAPRKRHAAAPAPAPSTAATRPPATSDSSAAAAAVPPAMTPPAMAQPTPAVPYIPASDKPVRISLATTKILYDTGAALFIDARDLSEYQGGHIPGALRMSRDDALGDPDRVKSLPVRGRPIVAYCDGGECEASLELAQALVGAGYRKVLVYGGGFPEWSAAGYPVAKGGDGK